MKPRHPSSMGQRRGVAIVLLSLATLAAAPALAQPSLEFSITAGAGTRSVDGPGDIPGPEPESFARRAEPAGKSSCLTNRQARRGLRVHDFDNIEIGKAVSDSKVEVRANYGGSLYRMELDRCSGRVSGVERVGRNPIGGFGLQFGY